MARTGRTSRLPAVLALTSTSRMSSRSTLTISGCCMLNMATLFANSIWLTASTLGRAGRGYPSGYRRSSNTVSQGKVRLPSSMTRHGWMILNSARATTSAFRAGALLVTSDGGRNWRDTHDDDPGGQGPVVLLTSEEGWMAGGEHDEDLYVTRDGAKSWQTISLPAPKELSSAKFSTADVPVFEDSKHGFVAVTYTEGHQSGAVLFTTDDGGRSWKPDRILSGLEETSEGHRSEVRHRRRHVAHRQSLRPSTHPHHFARRRAGCARLSIPLHTCRAISEPIN